MLEMINIKIDPKMKAAIQKAAEKQFISMSAFIKQAVEKQLQEQGINWREEEKKVKVKK
jgi:predicted HicB family RNase H-like nuclease